MSENQNIKLNVAEPDTSDTNVTVSQQQQQPQQPIPNEKQVSSSVNVNVNLLKNLNALMEIVISRGVFKANELTSVGKVYDELNKLLNQ